MSVSMEQAGPGGVSPGILDAATVRRHRALVYGNGAVSPDEIEILFRMDEEAVERSPEWVEFFAGAVVDYIVRQQPPSGYISEQNAAWLLDRIVKDGHVKNESELEVLVKVLETAISSPPSLSAFALRQVAAAILDGEGPLARGILERGRIGADEVALLRRILYAFGGHGAIAVTREEAEVLFDLNDRSIEADNDFAWSDLFVKAIANFLMASRGYAVLSREEALRREEWLDSGVVSMWAGNPLASLAQGLRTIWREWRQEEDAYAVRVRAEEAMIAEAEVVTSEEIRWLADRIGRDGVIHENERALLRFLNEETPDLHPSLRTLLDTAA